MTIRDTTLQFGVADVRMRMMYEINRSPHALPSKASELREAAAETQAPGEAHRRLFHYWRLIRGWITVFALVLLVGACTDDRLSIGEDIDDAARVAVEDFELRLMPEGDRVVSGTLYNPTRESLGQAQIQVALYDGDNQRVDSMIIAVRDVAPGSRKPFAAPVDSPHDVRGARPRSVLYR